MQKRGVEAYVAELVGTFALVFFIVSILTVASGISVTDWAVIGLVHAFVLAMLIYTLGATSGGHFNPAVTIAAASIKRIRVVDALVYIVVQLGGAILAVWLVKCLLGDVADAAGYGSTAVNQTFLEGSGAKGAIVEGIGTFFLMWAIMGLAINKGGARDWAGFIIGTTLGFLVMIIGPMTGAGLNPARWLGPAIFADKFDNWGAYVVGPVVGAVLAAFLYSALVLRHEDKLVAASPAAGE